MTRTIWLELSIFLKNPEYSYHPFFDAGQRPDATPYRLKYIEPLYQFVKQKLAKNPFPALSICMDGAGGSLKELYCEQIELIGHSVYQDYQEAMFAGWSMERQISYLDGCTLEQYAKIWLELLERHEILRQMVCRWTFDFLCHIRRMVEGIAIHMGEIRNCLGCEPGAVKKFGQGDSDIHDGACVHIIYFSSGEKIVYKPRSLKLDMVWQEYLLDMAKKAGMEGFVVPWILDFGAYGLEGFIEERPLTKDDGTTKWAAACSRFYQRAGFLLGIAYVLQGNDLHADNLIACGESPVFIDLETGVRACANTVFSDCRDSGSKSGIEDWYRFDSVLRTNMLPFLTMSREIRPGDDALTSKTVTSHNLPVRGENGDLAREYESEIEEGFRLAYDTVCQYGISTAFADCSVRFLIRNTSSYHDILKWCCQAESVKECGQFNQRLAYLEELYECMDTPLNPFLNHVLMQEQTALEHGYIPRLSVSLSTPWFSGSQGENITIASLLVKKPQTMCKEDRELQCHRIRIALNRGGPADSLYLNYVSGNSPAIPWKRAAFTQVICERIRFWGQVLDHEETVEGIVVVRKSLRYYLTTLPWNIMEGIPGLLPFLAAWHHITKDRDAGVLFERIADGTLRRLRSLNLAAYRPGMPEGLEGLLRMTQITGPMTGSKQILEIHDMVLKALGRVKENTVDLQPEDTLYYGGDAKVLVLKLEAEKENLCWEDDERFEAGLMGGLNGVLFPSFFRGEGGWLYSCLRKAYPHLLPAVLGKGDR